jgi:hypothetical protein
VGGVVPGAGESGQFGQVAGLGGEIAEQVEHRAPEAGMDEVRREVAHGHHHESALVHARVGDLQRVGVGDEVAVYEQVEVEGAWAPVHDALAFAVGFDSMEQVENVGGLERGVGGERGVEIGALVLRAADRCGLVEG